MNWLAKNITWNITCYHWKLFMCMWGICIMFSCFTVYLSMLWSWSVIVYLISMYYGYLYDLTASINEATVSHYPHSVWPNSLIYKPLIYKPWNANVLSILNQTNIVIVDSKNTFDLSLSTPEATVTGLVIPRNRITIKLKMSNPMFWNISRDN